MADMGNSGMMSQAELDALIMMSGDSEETSGDGMDVVGSASDFSDDISEDLPLEAEPIAPKPKPRPSSSGAGSLGMVDLPSFAPAAAAAPLGLDGASGISRVRDIPLEVTVELGRTRLLIRDILDLSVGSIIELDKIAGEPVDLFANGMLVARGEVIVIDDNFGVRVTEIITAGERSAEKDAHARAA